LLLLLREKKEERREPEPGGGECNCGQHTLGEILLFFAQIEKLVAEISKWLKMEKELVGLIQDASLTKNNYYYT